MKVKIVYDAIGTYYYLNKRITDLFEKFCKEDNLKNTYKDWHDIPRHHPALVKAVEQYNKEEREAGRDLDISLVVEEFECEYYCICYCCDCETVYTDTDSKIVHIAKDEFKKE